MICCHKRKFIFFHIPKTAGLSIYNSLNKHIDLSLITELKNQLVTSKFILPNEEIPLHINQQFLKKTNYNFKNFFEFVFVRNPYTRCISLTQHLNNQGKKIKLDQLLDIFEFNTSASDLFLKNQLYWTNNKLSEKLHIFYYENLESDFKKIKNILDIPYNPLENLMLFNYSRVKSSIDMLTKLQKNRIFNIFNEEFKTFGYNK